jgi:hypothetical protein
MRGVPCCHGSQMGGMAGQQAGTMGSWVSALPLHRSSGACRLNWRLLVDGRAFVTGLRERPSTVLGLRHVWNCPKAACSRAAYPYHWGSGVWHPRLCFMVHAC